MDEIHYAVQVQRPGDGEWVTVEVYATAAAAVNRRDHYRQAFRPDQVRAAEVRTEVID